MLDQPDAHSVSRRETCTSRAASLGPPLVCAARPMISATRGPWRGHGAAMRDIYMADNSMRAVFRWTRRGAEMLDATQPRMRWSVHGRTVDARDRGPRSTRARGAHGPSQVVPDPDRTASADAGRQGASGDAGPRSGKMCFGTLNSDASCTRRLVNLDPWLARRTSRAAGLDHVRLATCDNTEHAARAPPPAPPGPPPPAWGCIHEQIIGHSWSLGAPSAVHAVRCGGAVFVPCLLTIASPLHPGSTAAAAAATACAKPEPPSAPPPPSPPPPP